MAYTTQNSQNISLGNIIDHFMLAYVGENKLISKIKRLDVVFHAQRALQELSYDTLNSKKSLEVTVQSSLQLDLPTDYVNYTKISRVDSSGIKHPLYRTNSTSNPTKYQTDSDGVRFLDANDNYILSGELIKNGGFVNGSNWLLNTDGAGSGTIYSATYLNTGDPATDGDPEAGWHLGFNVNDKTFANKIAAFDVPQYSAVQQSEVPIISGQDYKITYTISNYSSGSFNFVIVDEKGDYTSTTGRTADGTYDETITAGDTAGNYPSETIYFQNILGSTGSANISNISIVRVGDEESSETWGNYKSTTPSENNNDNYEDDTYWPLDGSRFGLDPSHAQVNGSFFIDQNLGKIHFSSNVSGKTIILDYISDGITNWEDMVVHKFAEEAVYKWLLHAILSTRSNTPEHIVRRYKKERFAAIRQAKLRLSNFKLEEISQILRGKSKQIKH